MSRHGPWPLTAPPLNTPIGVQLKYLELIPSHKNMGKLVDENATQIFHAQLLFAHKGKWGDFHVSIVVRQSSDIQTAMELLNSFSIND